MNVARLNCDAGTKNSRKYVVRLMVIIQVNRASGSCLKVVDMGFCNEKNIGFIFKHAQQSRLYNTILPNMVIPIGFFLETGIGYVLDFTANQPRKSKIASDLREYRVYRVSVRRESTVCVGL